MPNTLSLDASFLEALFGEDELGAVVRAHIHIEAQVNSLLDLMVPYPAHLPRLRYEQNARLVCALGLAEESFAPLKVLGDIRNRFSHKLDTKLTDGMVKELYDAFSATDRQTILDAYAMTDGQLASRLPSGFSSLGPRDRFVIIAVALDKLLTQAREESRAAKGHL
ncbi:MAG: hypothetical protein ACRERD_28175 [Candidatus Binatia bacterium]